jgi:hypothetical protein
MGASWFQEPSSDACLPGVNLVSILEYTPLTYTHEAMASEHLLIFYRHL